MSRGAEWCERGLALAVVAICGLGASWVHDEVVVAERCCDRREEQLATLASLGRGQGIGDPVALADLAGLFPGELVWREVGGARFLALRAQERP